MQVRLSFQEGEGTRLLSNILKAQNILINKEKRFPLKKNIHVIPSSKVHIQNDDIKDNLKPQNKTADSYIHHTTDMVNKEAEDILEKAKQEAKAITSSATFEGEQLKIKAQQEGYQEGLVQGIQNAEEHFYMEIEKIQTIKDEILKEKEVLYQQFEKDLVNLAVDIAKKIIYDRLDNDDGLLTQIVESTLEKVQGTAKVQLCTSPQDYPKLIELKNYFMSKLKNLEDVEIIQYDYLKPGSCIIDTESGVIDGSLDTRIEKVETAFAQITDGIT
jgi:flagellar assembly protein FliH